MKLDEDQIRAKVIELLDRKNLGRMNMWISSGVLAGVLDSDIVERVMNEEINRRSLDVQLYWSAPCDICGPMETCGHLN